MIILFVGHEASRTGAPISLLNLAKWLKENKGIEASFLLGTGGELLSQYQQLGDIYIWKPEPQAKKSIVKRVTFKLLRTLKLLRSETEYHQKKIISQLKGKKIEIVFNNTVVNGDILDVLSREISAPIISRIPEMRASIQIYDQKKLSATKTFKYSNHLIAVSNAVKQNLVLNHGIQPEKVSIVYGATNYGYEQTTANESLRVLYNIPKEGFVVAGCGTLGWRKGTDIFIQAANEVIKRHRRKDIYFIWIGGDKNHSSYLQAIYELELLELKERVFFTGAIPNPHDYFSEIDLFLLPSREDPFPLVVMEAGSHGIPIICFDKGGGAQEFVETDSGCVVSYLDIEEMGKSILHYCDNPELRTLHGERALEKTKEFSIQASALEVVRVIEKVLGKSIL